MNVVAAQSTLIDRDMRRQPFARIALLAGALAIAGIGASANLMTAQEESPAESALPNIVLVHGLWADGGSWADVIAPLQADGYNVRAVQLPLTSVEADVAVVRNVLAIQPGPTLLVAHSFGGYVISALGPDAPNVAGLVYVAAFGPDEGESPQALANAEPAPPGAAAFRPDEAGNIWLDPAGFLEFFMPDVDPARARVFEASQKPVAGATFADDEPLGEPTWRTVPSWFLVTTQDQIVPPDAQRFFAQRMGATTSEVDAGHVVYVSQPQVVVDLIRTAAAAVSAES
jgi:pimeloyl-ACP methyl ester carboxylesterase